MRLAALTAAFALTACATPAPPRDPYRPQPYVQLTHPLKHSNTALWNGAAGARMIPVVNAAPEQVLSFVRANGEDSVFAVFNFSGEAREVAVQRGPHYGPATDYFAGEAVRFGAETRLTLAPHAFRGFVR